MSDPKKWDWALVALVIGFIVAVLFCIAPELPSALLARVIPQTLTRLTPEAPFAEYEGSLRSAAIKTEDDKRPLKTVEPGAPQVLVASFRYPSLPASEQRLESELWVSLRDDLRKECVGRKDAVRRLQQVLGLPPTTGHQMVYEISVRPGDLFRPCASGSGISEGACLFDMRTGPVLLSDPASTATPEEVASAQAAMARQYGPLREAYSDLRFFAEHMWKSYRSGFPAEHRRPGDYPFDGYPFTGMGWTYDWAPDSKTHVGVTEFIVRKEATIKVERLLTPEEFCAGS